MKIRQLEQNNKKDIKRILSASAPVMIAGDITANFIWKRAKRMKGTVDDIFLWGSTLTLSKKANDDGFPIML